MSSNQSESDNVARRLLQSFLEDINEFARSGGFHDSSASERRALNDLMTQRYLIEGIEKLPHSPIVKKVEEIISDFIHNKCRGLEYCALTRVKEEEEENSCGGTDDIPTSTLSWTCLVCGKCNNETKQRKQRVCVVCGRERNYIGSKKTQQLKKLRIDPIPLTTAASKDCLLKEVQDSNKRHHLQRWKGEDAKCNMLIATKADYEGLHRVEMKNEINDVLDSLRKTRISFSLS